MKHSSRFIFCSDSWDETGLFYFLLFFLFTFFMDMGVIIFSLYTVNGVYYGLGQSIRQFSSWKDSTWLADE